MWPRPAWWRPAWWTSFAATHRRWATGITGSVGVTRLDRPELTAEQLLVEGDVAMYQAKEAGRDGVHVHRPGTSPNAPRQTGLAWTDRIKTALERDLFVVHSQPIVRLSGDPGARYELLIRMAGEGDQLVPPRPSCLRRSASAWRGTSMLGW